MFSASLLSEADMELTDLLIEKESTILEKWFELIMESYPVETAYFLKSEKDRFNNPVAYEFRQGVEGIYEALLHRIDRDEVSLFLDKIISIRAIQGLSPSRAIAFIFLLKTALRGELEREIWKKEISHELAELESRIDGLALLCFDVYMKRREKLYEIRADEVKRRMSGLLRMTDDRSPF
jgi:hypothetical protein